jgi:hypothetical protein
MSDCPVCSGRGRITLPLRSELSAFSQRDFASSPMVEQTARDYDCPQCNVGRTGAKVFRYSATLDDQYSNDPDYVRSFKLGMQSRLLRALIETDLIEWNEYRSPLDKSLVLEAQLSVVTHERAREIGIIKERGPAEIEKMTAAPTPPKPKPKPRPAKPDTKGRFGELIFQDEVIEP